MGNSKERQNAIKRLKVFHFQPKSEVSYYREKVDEEFSEVFLPNRVEKEEIVIGSIPCDILTPEMYAKNRLMMYVHGGSFIGGSRKSHRAFASSLSNAFSCKTVLPEFRLPPAHQFPCAVNDIQDVFKKIVDHFSEEINEGEKTDFILAADTSGASIALGFFLSLKPQFRKLFSRIVLFSPWLDLSEQSNALKSRRKSDEVFVASGILASVEMYAPPEKRLEYAISPILAQKEQLESFPPVYIQMGEKELFMDEAEKFEALCADAHIPCTLDIWKGMMPLFQMADEFLSESHLAVEKIGAVVKTRKEIE